jgi:DNA polymerase-3 subunit epsilon
MTRYLCFDTETTGLEVNKGHRIIEIAFVEIINLKRTGKNFHYYLNPDREVDKAAFHIHGISNEFLLDKPKFPDIYEEMMNFVKQDSETILVAHNAKFDISFINSELSKFNISLDGIKVIDTVDIVRIKYPGSHLSLDSISSKLGIDLSERKDKGHGALLDSEILADVFIKLIDGFDITRILEKNERTFKISKRKDVISSRNIGLPTDDETQMHNALLQKVKSDTVW